MKPPMSTSGAVAPAPVQHLPTIRRISSLQVWPSAVCLMLAITLGLGLWCWGSTEQNPALPELPQLDLDRLPPTVRADAQKAYDAVLAQPRDASANGKLAMLLHAHNLIGEAEVCYRRAHLLDPTSFRWAYYLGLTQRDQAKCSEAVATFRKALSLDPDYLPARLRLGECLAASVQWQETGKVYEGIIQRHPDSAEAHYGLGRVRAAQNDVSGAVESFRKACELFPEFGAAHFSLARIYQRLGRNEQAQEELSLSQKNAGASPEIEDPLLGEVVVLFRDFDAYLRLASELGGQGKLEEAAAAYEEALRINPELSDAHIRLIYLYGRRGQVAKAEEHYRAALRLDPNKGQAYFNYGVVVLGQSRFHEAEDAFRKAVAIDPHHAEAHNNLGYLLEGQGKLSEAITEFRKALDTRAQFPQAHFSLGRILVKQQNYEDGIPHLLQALSTEDEDSKASYLYAIGIAFADVGDLQNGLRYLRKAREKAATRNQSTVLKDIDDDLRLLEGEGLPQ